MIHRIDSVYAQETTYTTTQAYSFILVFYGDAVPECKITINKPTSSQSGFNTPTWTLSNMGLYRGYIYKFTNIAKGDVIHMVHNGGENIGFAIVGFV